MNAKARKAEVNLKSLGTGVILFGAWTFIKFAVSYLIYGFGNNDLLDDNTTVIFNVIVWSVIAVAFLIRLYIGRSAHSESEGKRKHIFYLILTGSLVFIDILAIIAEFYLMFTEDYGILSMLITILIDVTSVVIMIELMVNAITIRKLRKKEAAA